MAAVARAFGGHRLPSVPPWIVILTPQTMKKNRCCEPEALEKSSLRCWRMWKQLNRDSKVTTSAMTPFQVSAYDHLNLVFIARDKWPCQDEELWREYFPTTIKSGLKSQSWNYTEKCGYIQIRRITSRCNCVRRRLVKQCRQRNIETGCNSL